MLVLEDGTTLRGTGFGGHGESFGEMVFNTGMTGYQETLTDPSYCGQIVAMTAPHIGNTGINDEDQESHRIWVSGYVVREPARIASSWRARRSLDAELKAQGITGIALTGTRALTMRLREHGAMRAAVSTVEDDPARLLDRVLASPGMTGADLARIVTTPHPYTVSPPPGVTTRYRVAAVDLGIKNATPQNMAARGMEVRVLPATVTAAGDPRHRAGRRVLLQRPRRPGRGRLRGRGDARRARRRGAAVRHLLRQPDPVPGGRPRHLQAPLRPPGREPAGDGPVDRQGLHHQPQPRLRGRASARRQTPSPRARRHLGARSPGGQEPFDTPYGAAAITHVNLNDGVVEGIRLLDRPAFAVQYHPEAAPGPHDAVDLFDQFAALMNGGK